jgi:hypothetical protein
VLVEAIEKNDLNGSSDRSRPLSSPPLEEEARATILRRVIAEASAAVTGRTRLRLARNDDAPVGQGAGAERSTRIIAWTCARILADRDDDSTVPQDLPAGHDDCPSKVVRSKNARRAPPCSRRSRRGGCTSIR